MSFRRCPPSAKASGVPGTVAGLTYAEQHYGKLGLKVMMQPAIRLASEGYVLSEEEARLLHSPLLTQFPPRTASSSATATSTSPASTFKQPELARHAAAHRRQSAGLLQGQDGRPDRRLREPPTAA
jgi:gamma-glutamyltranspeptidase